MNELTITALELSHREHFLTPDWLERQRYISTIRQYEKEFLAVLQALMEIKIKNLYRPYTNMNDFCRGIFGWSHHRTSQMLTTAKAVLALPASILPVVENERQVRELLKHPEDKRAEILDNADRFHRKDGKLTAKSIEQSANYPESIRDWVEDLNGERIIGPAVEYWNRRKEILDAMDWASKLRVFLEKIEERDPLYHNLWPVGRMHDELDGIYRAFRGILPSYVCGYCEGQIGRIEKCSGCNGTGLLSVFMDKSLPAEKRAHVRT
jgi:hypothetical protein